jgi:hypothetical protein
MLNLGLTFLLTETQKRQNRVSNRWHLDVHFLVRCISIQKFWRANLPHSSSTARIEISRNLHCLPLQSHQFSAFLVTRIRTSKTAFSSKFIVLIKTIQSAQNYFISQAFVSANLKTIYIDCQISIFTFLKRSFSRVKL